MVMDKNFSIVSYLLNGCRLHLIKYFKFELKIQSECLLVMTLVQCCLGWPGAADTGDRRLNLGTKLFFLIVVSPIWARCFILGSGPYL